jgi:hypothetical protein
MMQPGIHPSLTAGAYHADPCRVPSLSSGIAKQLIRRSPLHGWHEHPRYGASERDPSAAMDDGSVLHRLLLGAGGDYATVDADDWRTKAAKKGRDEIRAAGLTPILRADLDRLTDAADQARDQMRLHDDCADFFASGTSEAVLIAQDGPAWLRCMVDRMPADPVAPWYDIKTVARSAAPADFQRTMITEHAFQAAFYLRIGRLLGYRPPAFLFVVVEREAPHAVSVVTAAPSLMEIASREVERAVALWTRCQAAMKWPGYPTRTAYVEAPAWITAAEEAANMEELA